MFRYIFFALSVFFICLPLTTAWSQSAPNYQTPCLCKNTFNDVYIGVSLASLADISTNTAGNPVWGALYNPMDLLSNYGVNFNVGIRFFNVSILRNIRLEGEWQYRESRYKILKDPEKSGWLNQSRIPPYGKIYLKGVAAGNLYYDFRWFSDTFYPYAGFGLGYGNLGIRHIDFTLLPSGIGEEYVGYKTHVILTQFMAGLQYDTKILKTSVFVEYRFANSGKATAYPTYNGTESQKNDEDDEPDKPNPLPPDYVPPAPKSISYKAHAIIFGFKYYLY